MTDNNVFNMAEPSSLVADGIPFHTNFIPLSSSDLIVLNNRNQSMSGFPGPSALHRDNNLEACNDGTISDFYPTGNVQPERFSIGDFLCGALYPLNNAEVKGRYTEGMPLSATSLSNLLAARCNPHETLNKFASSTPFAYPLEVHRNVNPSDGSNTLIDNVPASTSTKWDTSNVITHPEPAGKDIGTAGLQPFGLMQNINPEGWVASQSTSLGSDDPGSSRLSNELSLSLATSNPSVLCRNFIQDHCSEICGSDSSPYDRCLASEQTSCSRNLSLSFDFSKPMQLSQFSSGSVYVNAIQEILAEVACYSHGNPGHVNYHASGIEDQADVSFSSSCTAGEGYLGSASIDFSDAANKAPGPMMQQLEIGRKKKHLLALLQVVDDQYSQCLDEIHTVISAFHAVTELNPDIHARFALQTISFLYKSLRERISNHILTLGIDFSNEVAREDENLFETSFIQKQWALQQLRRKDNQIWRPQRGLPERSVSVLRAWMFQNFLHPYPKDAEKHLLAIKSGLTRSQVSNWFINARVRLWKPMIEEMYAEMSRRKSRQNDNETNNNHRSRIRIDNQRFAML